MEFKFKGEYVEFKALLIADHYSDYEPLPEKTELQPGEKVEVFEFDVPYFPGWRLVKDLDAHKQKDAEGNITVYENQMVVKILPANIKGALRNTVHIYQEYCLVLISPENAYYLFERIE